MERLPEMKQAMVEFFMQHKQRAGEGIILLPGVKELMQILKVSKDLFGKAYSTAAVQHLFQKGQNSNSRGCSQMRGDVVTCLVTGNLEPIGWAKMEALGIHELFTQPLFGGFGRHALTSFICCAPSFVLICIKDFVSFPFATCSDYCSGNTLESWKDRAELVRIAAKRAEEILGGMKSLCDVYHFLDCCLLQSRSYMGTGFV